MFYLSPFCLFSSGLSFSVVLSVLPSALEGLVRGGRCGLGAGEGTIVGVGARGWNDGGRGGLILGVSVGEGEGMVLLLLHRNPISIFHQKALIVKVRWILVMASRTSCCCSKFLERH